MTSNSAHCVPTDGLTIYRVGGAVRDQLLDFPSTETDWVVVGADAGAMIERGFRQVGRDFPVFLHPDSHEEYALARTERKTAPGYHGFELHADPSVSLEEDLQRRDLTVNAMAMDEAGEIIDPYGGQADIAARVLRHVSDAFVEDPLRILRVARFAARYAHLGFTVAPETDALMASMVASGELSHLSAERIWTETERALGTQTPAVFFRVLNRCDALKLLFPDVDHEALWLLERAAPVTNQTLPRWGALMATLPLAAVEEIAKRLKIPNAYAGLGQELAQWLCRINLDDAASLYSVLMSVQAIKKPRSFHIFCEALAALDGVPAAKHDTALFLDTAREAICNVHSAEFIAQGLQGPELGRAIRQRRIETIERLIDKHNRELPLLLKHD